MKTATEISLSNLATGIKAKTAMEIRKEKLESRRIMKVRMEAFKRLTKALEPFDKETKEVALRAALAVYGF